MKLFLYTIAFLMAVVLSHRGGSLLYGQLNKQVGRTPVTITYKTTSFESPGRVFLIVEHYRSDGSVARAVNSGNDLLYPRIDVTDLLTKRAFVKDPVIKAYDEFPLTQATYDMLAQSAKTCEAAMGLTGKCMPLGNEQFLGHTVQRATLPMSKEGQRMELLLAPGFNFLPLKRSLWKGDKLSSETIALSVITGEPEGGVFTIPADYSKAASSSDFLSKGQVARSAEPGFDGVSGPQFDQRMNEKRQSAEGRLVK